MPLDMLSERQHVCDKKGKAPAPASPTIGSRTRQNQKFNYPTHTTTDASY